MGEEEIDTDEEYGIVYNILNGEIIFDVPDIKSVTNIVKDTLTKKYLSYLWSYFTEAINGSYLNAEIIVREENSFLSISSEE